MTLIVYMVCTSILYAHEKRHADSSARYDEIALQLFLQMLYESAHLEEDQIPPNTYPYMKCWLEWIPSQTLKDNAVGYRIHAVSLHDNIKFGKQLNKLLYETSKTHSDSMNRKMNSRKVDPLLVIFFINPPEINYCDQLPILSANPLTNYVNT